MGMEKASKRIVDAIVEKYKEKLYIYKLQKRLLKYIKTISGNLII